MPPGAALGIAVSGGSDSTALMHLAAAWGARNHRPLSVVTVDHGLRPEAATEARMVAAQAASLGLSHQTLRWTRPPGPGNLLAQARAARMSLMAEWARDYGLAAVLLGHTQDDQAETLLMRLARGAGIDGLAGMAPQVRLYSCEWLRPLLDASRADLQGWLTGQGVEWANDPTNDDDHYERVRIRKAIAALGLPMQALAQSAANLASARQALDEHARTAVAGFAVEHGALVLPSTVLSAPDETRRRLVIAGLRWVTGADFAPRGDAVTRAIDAIGAGRQTTLNGVIVAPRSGGIAFLREPAACAGLEEDVWDNRWRIHDTPPGSRIVALGDRAPDQRRAAVASHLQAASTPACVLPDGRVIALAFTQASARATLLRDDAAFLDLLSH
ncbi:MAG: tRNA lysidine(34) synthetase TilS [Paracoccus denitrificans]|nr:MAG: tRNA lysidine(34) synthetase TilS [Paracoccus denitrificans]PZO85877.1 MAG: tRNA lysidine(34) synthetase TilS [Paracoccus denitrificans]